MITSNLIKMNDVLEIPAHNEVNSGHRRARYVFRIEQAGGADDFFLDIGVS